MSNGNIISKKNIIIDSAVSLIIIAVILYFIGIDKIISELAGIDYFYLLLSIIFLLIMYLVMVYRLKLMLDSLGSPLPLMDIMRMHWVGMLLADFTPARTGYLLVAYGFTKKHKIPEGHSTVAVLGPQIYDFMAKVILGSMAMLYLVNVYLKMDHSVLLFLGAFAMAGMVAVMALLLFSKRFLDFFKFARRISFADKILSIFEQAQKNSDIIIKKFPQLFALLLLSWTSKAISWYFVAKSLHISLETAFPEAFAYFFLQPLLTIFEFLPSPTLAGLGLSEGGGVLVFGVLGVGAAKAASFIFLARVKTILLNLPAVQDTISLLHK